MSGILGVFTRRGEAPGDAAVRRMLDAMSRRGAESLDVWRDGPATLAVVRHGWELASGFSGPGGVAWDADFAVVADASVYYREDLLRALREAGVRPEGDSASHLILAAYRAWREGCAERLEGDWAFAVWDRTANRVFCARDFGGKRPLFYAETGGTLIVASTISALLAHPGCSHELNLRAVAADAAGLFAVPDETCYRAVSTLPAGCGLAKQGKTLRVARHWSPPPVQSRGRLSFEAAAEELRAILERSVAERLAIGGPTSVWLSGGWDSTAVFGSGEQVLRPRGGGHLRAVSLSYPPGDPGREDELIEAVVDHWGSPVHWIPIDGVPFLGDPTERAASRDEPFAHAFEMGNRALAEGSRTTGARVALDGVGGDQLFQVSDVYLADLLRTGGWTSLAGEWRSKGVSASGFRNFFRWAIQPNLPPPLLSAAARLRGGRPLRGYLERPLPAWIRKEFARDDLLERERAHTPRRQGPSRAGYETFWYLSHPYFPRAFARVAEFALEGGVELRSPLYDRRVIEFAVSRPRSERSAGGETKRLLRRAMRGLLPEHVLAPRPFKTGLSGAYFDRSMRRIHAPLLEATFGTPLRLAELGIVDPGVLRQHWHAYLRRGREEAGINLFFTFQAELWLRAHLGPERP